MININTIIRTPSAGGGGGASGRGGSYNVNINKTAIEGHYLWGRYFDATQDISGDLEGVGNIYQFGDTYSTGSATYEGDLKADNGEFSGDLTAGGRITAQEGFIKEVQSDTIRNTGKITTSQIDAVQGYIKDLLAGNLTVDNLTVTKAARFFSLIIDEIKSSQGMFILGVGNTDLDHVGKVDDHTYRCFYKSTDPSTGKKIYNSFEPYDQVVCQTFNLSNSNKWYWMLCTGTGTVTFVPFASETVLDAALANFDKDGDGIISIDEFSAIDDIGTIFSGSGITGTFHELRDMNVTALKAGAFAGSRLTGITLPKALRTVGNRAFEYNADIRDIIIPMTVTRTGDYAFRGCTNLRSVSIPSGTLGKAPFSGCTSLSDVELPEGLTNVGKDIFEGCESVVNLILPSTVQTIEYDALHSLKSLQRVWIKAAVPPTKTGTDDNDSIFDPLPELQSVYVPDEIAYEEAWLERPELIKPYTFEPDAAEPETEVATDEYHFFDLDTQDRDKNSNSVPEAGDSVAVLGNRYDTERQNAVLIGAYNIAWLDPEVKAPFISQYAGIDDYNLTRHRLNVISNGRNEFYGNFKVKVGGEDVDLEDFISENSGFELETDSEGVFFFTDAEGYITSLKDSKGLPTAVWIRFGQKRIPVMEWDNGAYIQLNGNDPEPLREGKEE